jgi:hypothetical protein
VDTNIHVILTSELVGGEWSASRPGCLTPRERATGTHWIGGWVEPRTGMDDVEKRNLATTGTRILTPAFKPVASRYTDCAIFKPE